MAETHLNIIDVCRMLRRACREAGGQKKWADSHGLSASYVSHVLHARCDPGKSILAALGLTMRVVYIKRPEVF